VQAGVSDGGTLSYRWYSNSENSNSGCTLISGVGNSSYTPPTNVAGTVYYYAVVTNTNNGVNRNKTAAAVSNTAAVIVVGGGTGNEMVFVPGGSFQMGQNGTGTSDRGFIL
jgi:molybdopterin biosynthesis enzyme MoaB